MTRVLEDLSASFITLSLSSTSPQTYFSPPTPSMSSSKLQPPSTICRNIHNISISPIPSCTPDFTPNFHLLFNFRDNIIMEDFNARNPAWYSQTTITLAEKRGTLITESLQNFDLVFSNLNLDSPTRDPTRGDPTSPDITIASSHIVLDSEWRTLTTLSSDHLPIIVQLGSSFQINLPKVPVRFFQG